MLKIKPTLRLLTAALLLNLLIPAIATADNGTFTNPIMEGADPWVFEHEGTYYLVQSEGQVGVSLRRSDDLTRWGDRHVIWQAPEDTMYSREVWAPKLYHLDGRWYIYTAASDGQNKNHRMYVFQSEGDDPLGPYTNKGALYTGNHIETGEHNRWAIDGIVMHHQGQRYFVWSGWPADGDVQYLYIAEMTNPWTISTNRVKLADNADYDWERVNNSPDERGLHEGPQVLKRDGRLMLVYSCSASWLPTYKLGLLTLQPDGDPMNPDHWHKHPEPVFAPTDETFGVGHNSFTTSPDGTEDWIVYHAKVDRNPGWRRAIYAQPFNWTDDGLPDLGQPVAAGEPVPLPSGQAARDVEPAFETNFETSPLENTWSFYGHHRAMDVRDDGLHLGVNTFQDPAYMHRTGEKVVRHNFHAADLHVQTRLRFVDGNRDAGILFRIQRPAMGYDAQQGYFAGLVPESQMLILGKTDGENWQELARTEVTINTDEWHELAVTAEGETIVVHHNGEAKLEHQDATWTQGSVGLRVVDTHAVFEAVEATTLVPASHEPRP
ncbi:MAG: family 43 glycosylhydrolase [Phycisphaeraceae bacterium]